MENKQATVLMNGYEGALRGAYEGSASYIAVVKQIPPIDADLKKYNVETVSSSSVALSAAFGAAVSGRRAFCMIDELCSDQLACYSLSGINGALVIVYMEDETYVKWDSRLVFGSCHYPILEPKDAAEIKRFVKIAYNMSEKYDVPIVIRASYEMLASLAQVDIYPEKIIKDRQYKKDTSKYSLTPTTIALCESDVVERDRRLRKDCETFPINTIEKRGDLLGIVAAGEQAALAKQALPEASILSLGITNPLPIKMIGDFAKTVKKLIVLESRPYIETILRQNDLICDGSSLFPREGRKKVAEIEEWLANAKFETDKGLPVRVADFCNDCPLVPIFIKLKKYELKIFTDLGCTKFASGFLSVGDVAIPKPIAAACAFSTSPNVLCVVSEAALLKEIEALGLLSRSSAKIIVLKHDKDISCLTQCFGIESQSIDIEDIDEGLDKALSGPAKAVIINAKRCKYDG